MPWTRKMRCWGPPSPPDGIYSSDNLLFAYFCIAYVLKFGYNLSVKLPTGKLKVNPRAGIGRGRQTRFFPATAPGTPATLMYGTLRADNLRITGPDDGPHMSDRMAGKRPVANTSTSIDMAEPPAKDAVVKRKKGSQSAPQDTLARHDPREVVRTL